MVRIEGTFSRLSFFHFLSDIWSRTTPLFLSTLQCNIQHHFVAVVPKFNWSPTCPCIMHRPGLQELLQPPSREVTIDTNFSPLRNRSLTLLAPVSDPIVIFKATLNPNLPGMGPARWIIAAFFSRALLASSCGLLTDFGNVNLMFTASITFGSNKSALAFVGSPNRRHFFSDPNLFPQIFKMLQRIYSEKTKKIALQNIKKIFSPWTTWPNLSGTRISGPESFWELRSISSLLEQTFLRSQVDYDECAHPFRIYWRINIYWNLEIDVTIWDTEADIL